MKIHPHRNYGENNPAYKGDSVGYFALHDWVRRRIKKPKLCVACKQREARDLANISGTYQRDLSDWEYLCRKCHMDKDGRNEQLRKSGKSRKLSPKLCEVCSKEFHRGSGMHTAKYCSRACFYEGNTDKKSKRLV